MKNKTILIIVGMLIVAAAFWKSCSKEESKGHSTREGTTAQRQFGNWEPKSRLEEINRYVQRGNVPITFYGRVIDEHGAGLDGVTVGYRIQRGEALLEAVKVHADRGTVVSGDDGMFEISKRKGSSLEVGPFVKSGYRDAQRDVRSFGYMGSTEPYEPDAHKPVLFVMAKEGTPRTKDLGHKTLKFAWNQGEIRIPLGKKLGDFVLVPTRVKSQDELRNFDWNIKVSMESAELASLGEYYLPIAPDAGYQSVFEYGARKGDSKWHGGLQATYAFKTAEGLFGLIRFTLYPERDDFVVNGSLDVHLNESGSRNLD